MPSRDSIEIVRADWPAPANVFAGVTTRKGGLSRPPFDGLNLAGHVGDTPEAVEANRRLFAQQAGLPNMPAWLEQVHGCQVATLVPEGVSHPQADASVSTRPRQVCAVMTADCLPVLFCDAEGRQVAAAHAGWRGLLAGVLIETVRHMSAPPADILAWMGPAISAQNYEVDDRVRNAFLASDDGFACAFAAHGEGHWLLDVYAVARAQLGQLGVSHVYGGNFCTFRDADRFYSYRRQQTTGRMASFIWFED